MPDRLAYRTAKRALDLGVALLGLIITFPMLTAVAILVRVKLGSPVLFRQERAGLGGQPFHIFKFRTMTDARDASGALLPDDIRLTSFGKFLRTTSLDELPQLFNVIAGQMSLVGPRPLFVRYIPRYNASQKRRLEVAPGITGLAQINGRNTISWDEKFALDVRYVDSANFVLDLRILFATAMKVLRRSDINQGGHATMPEFMGNEGKQ